MSWRSDPWRLRDYRNAWSGKQEQGPVGLKQSNPLAGPKNINTSIKKHLKTNIVVFTLNSGSE